MATYPSDPKAKLFELEDFPQMEPGSPSPIVVRDEYVGTFVAYDIRSDLAAEGGEVCLVLFEGVTATYWGAPNEEALHGHPLYKNGLKWYAGFEVSNSPWVASLEKMNRVHSHHRPSMYASCRHFVITFHDSTFECVADGYKIERRPGYALRAKRLVDLLMPHTGDISKLL